MRKHRLMQKKRKDLRQTAGQTLGSVDSCRREHSLCCLRGSTPPHFTSPHLMPPQPENRCFKINVQYLVFTLHYSANRCNVSTDEMDLSAQVPAGTSGHPEAARVQSGKTMN